MDGRPEISVIMSAHDEGVVSGPTMRSAERAIAAAEHAGVTVERMVTLDRPSRETTAFFAQERLKDWRVVHFDFGDPYPTRNAAVGLAAGQSVAFIDGDDLVSENWLARAHRRQAEAPGHETPWIVHPEMNVIFDGDTGAFLMQDQTDPLFPPTHLYFHNTYDMMCLAPRRALLEVPYAPRDPEAGFGFQDWQWNIETMAAGWTHVVARDTVVFKRRRRRSITAANLRRNAVLRSLEPMAIDRVRSLTGSKGEAEET